MRTDRLLALCGLLCLLAVPASAQNASQTFRSAYDAFSQGNFARSLALLDDVERSVGRNPRVESLRVHVYFSQRDFIRARIALDRYQRSATRASGRAHQELLALGPHIDEGLRQMEFTWRDSVQSRRAAEADRIIAQTYQAERQRVEAQMREAGARQSALQREFDAYNQMISSTDRQSAESFVREFPGSVRRDTAVVLWRSRYIASARLQRGEEGVATMRRFRSIFDSYGVPTSVRSEVNAVYAQHVEQARQSMRQEYASNAISARQREMKAWGWTAMYPVMGFALGTLLDSEGEGYAPIMAGGMLALSLAIDQPWTAGEYSRRRNRDIQRRLADLDAYPRIY